MNKKLILSLIAFVALAGFVVADVVLAEPVAAPVTPTLAANGCNVVKDLTGFGLSCPTGECTFDSGNVDCGICCLMNSVVIVTDWIFVLIMIMVSLMIIIGAFNYVTSGGDPGKTTSGRNFIMYAAIGLVIALFAKAIPYVVMLLVGIQATAT